MQRNRFEMYRGGIWFLLEYQLHALQGDSVREGHLWSSHRHLFLTVSGFSPEIFEGVVALSGVVKLGSITNVTQSAT